MRWASTGIGEYQISDHGDVQGPRGPVKFKIIRGRKIVKLGANSTCVSVHRLVAKAFCENPEHLDLVIHIDADYLNCHYTNLKWSERKSSIHDCICRKCQKQKALEKFPLRKAKGKLKDGTVKTWVYRYRICNSCIGTRDYQRRKQKQFHEILSKLKNPARNTEDGPAVQVRQDNRQR